jgi:hypothetical protein
MPALAVTTSHWTQSSEADFVSGTLHNVVATNLGELKLSRAVKTIMEQDPKVDTVYCLAQAPDGTVYLGTGPKGVVLSVKDDKVTTAATIESAPNIYSLCVDRNGQLLIGTGGDHGRVLRLAKPGDKPVEIFSADGVQYVYAIVQAADGTIYAATGPNGQLFQINPDGSNSVLYKSDEDNLLSMIYDGADTLYVGTHPNGLVIRVNRKTKKVFFLYNAAESEVTALALDADGNLYAATGDVSGQSDHPDDDQAKDKTGKPEGKASGDEIPSQPPTPPTPPAPPTNPNPGQPNPIPKANNPAPTPAHANDPAFNKESALTPVKTPNSLEMSGPPRSAVRATTFAQADVPDHGAASPAPPAASSGGDAPATAPSTTAATPSMSHDDAKSSDGATSADDGGAAAPATADASATTTPADGATPPAAAPADNSANGNAIYKIDKDGFVTEVFREAVTVYSMIEDHGKLLVGTGGEGMIYEVDPAADETDVVAKVDAKEVTALLAGADGKIYVGLANTGSLGTMSSGYAPEGVYTSTVLDATQSSRFGKIHLDGTLPAGSTLKVSTRSGNTKNPASGGWSDWTDDVPATEYLPFDSAHQDKTPVVQDVDVAYQTPNMAPVVKAIKIEASQANKPPDQQQQTPPPAGGKAPDALADKPSPTPIQTITWDASDPNNDTLIFSLYFRTDPQGPWILLKDKLKDPTYDWDTRNVADGRYDVKVVASDAPNNPPGQEKTGSRVSETLVIDNTPPEIGDLKTRIAGHDVQIDVRAVDATSTVAGIDYCVDSAEDWQDVEPLGKIYDSPSESASFKVTGLSPGPHQVTIRSWDTHGNQAFENVQVNID